MKHFMRSAPLGLFFAPRPPLVEDFAAIKVWFTHTGSHYVQIFPVTSPHFFGFHFKAYLHISDKLDRQN